MNSIPISVEIILANCVLSRRNSRSLLDIIYIGILVDIPHSTVSKSGGIILFPEDIEAVGQSVPS